MIIDGSFKIEELPKDVTITSQSSYTNIFSKAGKGGLMNIYLSVSSDNVILNLNVDGNDIIKDFLLEDLRDSSVYDMTTGRNATSYNFPIKVLDPTTFIITMPDGGLEVENSISLDLKKDGSGTRKLKAGLICYL